MKGHRSDAVPVLEPSSKLKHLGHCHLLVLTIHSTSDDEDPEQGTSYKQKRKKKIYENTEARDLREKDRERIAAQEERRKRLLANLAKSGDQGDGADIIINETKLDQEGFIYVNQKIARRIKKHQVEGVRFLWNQIVAGKQGCLLAHTMGLGKTMQT